MSAKTLLAVVIAGCLLITLFWVVASAPADTLEGVADWRSEWAVAEGLSLQIDTEGYDLPTAIAFVPNPGPGPKDPLYFVTELRGKVKVVTNDRSVYTFAEDFFYSRPERELPEFEGETGLAGICLAPTQGYVFVTFAYHDDEGLLRNNIVRFDSEPEVFAIQPSGQVAFTELFANYEAAVSHQVGPCQVVEDMLYVSVADGWQSAQSQRLDSLLGKILRMSLDGQPLAGNPFYQNGEARAAVQYVWAYGFRNPFGLKVINNRVFTADNGSDVDRFIEVEAGENYLWDGSDWSIGARADIVIAPDVGPAQLDYYPGGAAFLPERYGGSFFTATSRPEEAGVLRIPYSLAERRAHEVPEFIVRYQGNGTQILSGLALGPDGLYFLPILPDATGHSAILKVTERANPEAQHPYLLIHSTDAEALMRDKGCFGCHSLNGEGGTAAPPLDQSALLERLDAQLHSEAYLRTLAQIERLEQEPYRSYRQARNEVMEAEDREKLRTWTIYHIMEPRFDNPYSQMPNLGLSKTEATIIADYLLEERSYGERFKAFVLQFLPPLLPRHIFFAFVAGLIVGAGLLGLWLAVTQKRGWRWRQK